MSRPDLSQFSNEYVAVVGGIPMYPHGRLADVLSDLKKGGVTRYSIYWCGPGEPLLCGKGTG